MYTVMYTVMYNISIITNVITRVILINSRSRNELAQYDIIGTALSYIKLFL